MKHDDKAGTELGQKSRPGWFRAPSALAGVAMALAVASPAYAGSYGGGIDRARVVDVAPIYESVQRVVPRESCYIEQVSRPRYVHGHDASVHRRHGGATAPVVGALIGGALGHAVGHSKRNKQVGAALGAILGGSIGYDASRRHRHDRGRYAARDYVYAEERRCEVVDDVVTEERINGYDVTYEYAGERYTTRMHDAPGDTIRVRVRVTPIG